MLGLLDMFRKRKKVEEKTKTESASQMSDLEQICGDDKEIYQSLMDTMFLDPRKVGVSMKDAAENAKKNEREKNFKRAIIWYEIAGSLAIYEGNVEKVIEYFSKCEKLSPETKYLILKRPEEAVGKALEYYNKFLKD